MGPSESSDMFFFGDFCLDRRGLFCREGGGPLVPVKIGSRALDILKLLVDQAGGLVSKDEIVATVWPQVVVEDSNLTVQISALRHLLDQRSIGGSYIQTVAGRGYRFVAPVTRREASTSAHLTLGTVRSPAQRLSIVVLPFTNLSDNPDQQFFADGITEDLTTCLSRVPHSFVISRHTAFTYQNRRIGAKEIGRELGVRYVLEGSIRRAAKRVRVTVQLVDADTDAHLWAERYDVSWAGVFEVQDEIVTAIVGAIEPELLKVERERISSRPLQSEDAYELYHRGMFHHYRQRRADNIEAQTYFRRALAIEPRYPQVTAALSIALSAAAMFGWSPDADEYFKQAYELAEQAVVLDARYPNSHFALGLVCMWTHRREQALAAFEEAIKLNASFAAAHVLLGQMYLYGDQPEKAIEIAEKGIRLSPNDPRLFIWLPALAGAHYMLRRYAEAIEAGRRSWSLNRSRSFGLRYVVAGLGQLGRIEEARAVLGELKLIDPDLVSIEASYRRNYQNPASVEHIMDGLRKAGFK